jgi:hypothetical protein
LYGISPPGVGWDCYGTYEVLLLAMIPIIDILPYDEGGSLFDGLPVIHIDKLLKDDAKYVTQCDILIAIHDYVSSPDFQ